MRGKLKDPALADALRQVEDMIGQSIDASRSLACELSPPVLHQLGLAPALEWLGEQMRETHGLNVEGRFDDVPECGDEVRTFLFHAAREILFNVVKHAGVDRARVRLERAPDGELRLTIEDDGRGFDPASAAGPAAKGFGLFAIRERIGLLGGRFEVDAAPGRGCSFTLCFPPASADRQPA